MGHISHILTSSVQLVLQSVVPVSGLLPTALPAKPVITMVKPV